MRETFGEDACGRAEQLVGYFYGEADAAGRADFERHLTHCAACRDELVAFGLVRRSVADWRAELVRAAPAVPLDGFASDAVPASHVSAPASQSTRAAAEGEIAPGGFESPRVPRRQSARAAWGALAEFFRLSPAWLRASTIAASLALCALAGLAVADAEVSFGGGRLAFRANARPAPARGGDEQRAEPSAGASAELATAQARLSQLAAERDAAVRELEDTRAQLEDSRAVNLVAAEFEEAGAPTPDGARGEGAQRRTPAAPPKRAGGRNTRRAAEDEDLPRLLDLLSGAN